MQTLSDCGLVEIHNDNFSHCTIFSRYFYVQIRGKCFARSSIVGGTVAMFRASWKLSAAVVASELQNHRKQHTNHKKPVSQETLTVWWVCQSDVHTEPQHFRVWFCFRVLEGLAVAGHWSSSGSQSQQPSGIDVHFHVMF